MHMKQDYFLSVQSALHEAGIGAPVLVIDRDRLHHNLDRFRQDLPQAMAYRIVAKSLPGRALLQYVAAATQTDRFMSFNTIMLAQLLRLFPHADHMMGKPVTLNSMRQFYADLPRREKAAAGRVHWLVDSVSRLSEVKRLAEAQGLHLNICLEIDVGLHRGGFEDNMQAALQMLGSDSRLRLTGLLGYEPHLPKLPALGDWPLRAKRAAWKHFADVFAEIARALGQTESQKLIRNMAGSPTFRLYRDTSLANELAAGSVMVKPSDFDTRLLRPYQPACFIATPILKRLKNIRMPAHEEATDLIGPPASGTTLFTHGGYWMADPVFPAKLAYNELYGRSSNQEMITAPSRCRAQPGDFVFLRPRQSEAVMLQFPHWAVYQDGRIVDMWTPLPVSA